MDKALLTDESVYPDLDVIKKNLTSEQFAIYKKFLKKLEELGLDIEWRYYSWDSKCWLGKLMGKKKNIGWLSFWNTGFWVNVFFTEKTIGGLPELKLAEREKNCGKLMPILTHVNNDTALNELVVILDYKKSLK